MTVRRTVWRLFWLALAVGCLALYVGLVLGFGLGNPWHCLGATQLRAFLPSLALFVVAGDLLRLTCEPGAEADAADAKVEAAGQEKAENVRSQTQTPAQTPPPPVAPAAEEASVLDDGPGAEDFQRARAMRHQKVPDYTVDGLYLDLLGESAAKGYAPALALLGEYAMRRGAWVEAYYWVWRAQKAGMANLEGVLRDIRQGWTRDGCQSEEENVYELFDEEAGSAGRALLGIATGRDAQVAREYLQEHNPELL